MKFKFLPFSALLLALASVCSAQEIYSLPASAGNVTTLSTVITGKNRETCARFQLVATCTQAQACTAAGAAGGASCTSTQARASAARIYPLTQPGREEFVTFELTLPQFIALVSQQQGVDRLDFCTNWNAAAVGTRNTFCTTIGLAAGCNPGC